MESNRVISHSARTVLLLAVLSARYICSYGPPLDIYASPVVQKLKETRAMTIYDHYLWKAELVRTSSTATGNLARGQMRLV